MPASLTAVVHSPENKCPLVERSGVSADQSPKGALEPVSVGNRTGLRPAEMEIGKWRAEHEAFQFDDAASMTCAFISPPRSCSECTMPKRSQSTINCGPSLISLA
jgi:hypothetical protein